MRRIEYYATLEQVEKKIARLSYNQLLLLEYFLRANDQIVTVEEMASATPLKQKVLGGVLSSLSRTKFRGISLIEPRGKAKSGVGLRWQLNTDIIDVYAVRKEIASLLASY